jgi:hypothetical protein
VLIALPAVLEAAGASGKSTIQIGDSKKKAPSPIVEKLKSRKVSFYFNDTSITKALDFIADLTEINFILDIPEEQNVKVSLRVKKMALGNALHWLCKLAKVKYSVVDEAIYVGKKPKSKKILKMYNVKDLLYPARDFPGPKLQITTDDDEEPFDIGGDIQDDQKVIDPMVLIETIKRVTSEEPIED